MVMPKQSSFGPYKLLESLYAGKNSSVYRAQKSGAEDTVILKVLNTDYPSAIQVARFQHEFNIMRTLDSANIPKTYDWIQEGNRVGIALQDIGAKGSVEQLNSNSNELDLTLDIAVQVAEALLVLNKEQIVHKDIKSPNVILNPETNQVQLIDYGLATELSSEEQVLTGHEDLEGTLPYIAPEQTGRMNSTVDYRTDFYSFGIFLYELFSGEKPFAAEDAIGWVHCHVAKSPQPWQKNPDLPKMLETIVMKLLSKKKEDRYQSAAVLLQDLKECQRQWQEKGHIEPFKISKNDIPSHFQVSHKLYGRDEELGTLLDAFDRVAEGEAGELILVAGYSGIGKSALVREVHKPLVAKHGYFIEGKFDQFKATIPFSAMAQALGDLMQQLLKQPKEELLAWKETILTALEGQSKIIIDIVPELALVIEEQPEVEELGGVERLNRLNYMLKRFINVFTTPDHPLVLFLDDLQWVDDASLGFLQAIMQREDSRYLLLIGAYRDNEVDSAHPLMKTVEDLKKAKVIVHTLKLYSLTPEAIAAFVKDTLYTESHQVQELAALLHKKTGGNPFFLTQFLKTLYQEGVIQFDYDASCWRWNAQQIESHGFTDNVVELMLSKIRGFSEATQTLLGLAACAGNQFNLKMLAVIAKQHPVVVARNLWPALELEILLSDGDQLKLIKNMSIERLEEDIGNIQFRFLHDRVQQAAYQLIAEEERAVVHLTIGQVLLEHYSQAEQQEHCFDLADQFNKGRSLIVREAQRLQLIELNISCGKQASATAAYQSAVDYLQLARGLLPETAWQEQTELTFTVHLELARALYMSSQHDQAEAVFHVLMENTRAPAKQLAIYLAQINQYTLWGKFDQAVSVARQALLLQGIALADSEEEMQTFLNEELVHAADYHKEKDLNDIINLPVMTSPAADNLMRILNEFFGACYDAGLKNLYSWGVVKMVNHSTKHGMHPSTGIAYVNYGVVLCAKGELKRGVEFGQLGIALAKQSGQALPLSTIMVLYSVLIGWNKESIDNVIKICEKAYQYCMRCGNLVWAGYSVVNLTVWKLEMSLSETFSYAQSINSACKLHFSHIWQKHSSTLWLTAKHTDHSVDEFDERISVQHILDTNSNASHVVSWTHANRILDAYLSRDYFSLEELSLMAKNIEISLFGMYCVPRSYFFISLCLLATYRQASDKEKKLRLEKIEHYQSYIKNFARRCEASALHKYLLIEAEKQRVRNGNMEEITNFYVQAIQSAREHGYLLYEAIGNELYGEFWLERAQEKLAYVFLFEARYAYDRWGGKAKVRQLEQTYPKLTTGLDKEGTHQIYSSTYKSITNNFTTTLDNLDLSSIIKASQALSGEIKLESLIAKLMDIVIENAGAQRGVLLLNKSDQWFTEAASTIDESQTRIWQSKPVNDLPDDAIPKSVINYIIRTQEAVVLDNASEEGDFTEDPHIKKHKSKSLLVLPIISQGKLIGMLGLQNFQAIGVFTPNRLEVLKTITAQVAISLENTKLYENLEHLVEERTQDLSKTLGSLQETQEELIKAKEIAETAREAAETANKAKSAFLANMSHELRSPLNAILGFSNVLRRDVLGGSLAANRDQQENLNHIYRSGEYLLTLINNVLELSKIESGNITLNPINFDLYVLLKEIEHMYALQAREKVLSLQFERASNLPRYIRTDAVKLRQVLINLLSNAFKFTEQGGVIVHVAQTYADANADARTLTTNGRLLFEVTDSGPGIAAAEMDQLFIPFAQTQTGQKAKEGTGLGLAISRQFVNLMGGEISVHSKVGRGTTFRFEIEVSIKKATAVATKAPTCRIVALRTGQRKFRLLIVDNNEPNRQLLIRLLKPLGFELQEARNGKEAIALWRTWQPDLIWMDMRMPVMDGYQATQAIKADPKGKDVKIIALTASAFEEKRNIIAVGCDGYYRKPVRDKDIFEAMHHHLGVRYIYEHVEEGNFSTNPDEVLTPETLKSLPAKLLGKLQGLAVRARPKEIAQVIEEIRFHEEGVANALASLANQFKFSKITEIIQSVKDSDSGYQE